MSEKLCLKWNDFKENVMNTFASLREDKDLVDVTLVCEDGEELELHKVVLANSSPIFQNILRKNRNTQPLIFMRGVKSKDLIAIVDFLYYGEANVLQENLDSFLALAEDLQLKGLVRNTGKEEPQFEDEAHKIDYLTEEACIDIPKKRAESSNPSHSNFEQSYNVEGGEVALINHSLSGGFQELEERCLEMMTKTTQKNTHGQAIHQCKVCGKADISGSLKRHIESKHMEGVSIPCNYCEKTFRSRNSLSMHIRANHKVAKF